MTTVCCPDCGQPVNVPAHAREGRCDECRPRRQDSKPRRVGAGDRYRALLAEHQDHR